MRVLIDTCIVIDALQSRLPFKDDAERIFLLAANNIFDGYISAKTATDIYYLTHKCTHSVQDTRSILSKLLSLFDPLDTYGIDCRKAILSDISDYEDAVMVETAIREGIDYIVTRNTKDFAKSTVTVLNPKEFLELFTS